MITLGPKDIIRGESKSEWVADGGFSPDSYGLNLTKKRGALYFIDGGTERGGSGATLTGNVIASAFDKNYLGNENYFLDDEGAFYTYSGTTLTKRQTVTTDTFALGTTDMVQFKGVTYATGQQRIQALTGGDLTGLTDSFWSGLDSSYRHPLERVEDSLYVGNINVIGKITDVATTTAAEITLPTDVNITSLRKHPDGRTLLAFCGLTANLPHTKGLGGRVYYIDTVLKKWTREIELDVQVEGSRVVGGVVYVSYGNNIGYFDGNGIINLKRLATSTTTYSQNMVAVEDILMTRDGKNVLMFGDLGAGRVWWKVYRNSGTQNINNVAYKGDNQILISFSDGGTAGLIYELDLDNVGVNGSFFSNHYVFEGETHIDRLEILHDLSDPAGTTRFLITSRDHAHYDNPTVLDKTYSSQSVLKTREEIDIKTDMFQFSLVPLNDDIGFYQFRFNNTPI